MDEIVKAANEPTGDAQKRLDAYEPIFERRVNALCGSHVHDPDVEVDCIRGQLALQFVRRTIVVAKRLIASPETSNEDRTDLEAALDSLPDLLKPDDTVVAAKGVAAWLDKTAIGADELTTPERLQYASRRLVTRCINEMRATEEDAVVVKATIDHLGILEAPRLRVKQGYSAPYEWTMDIFEVEKRLRFLWNASNASDEAFRRMCEGALPWIFYPDQRIAVYWLNEWAGLPQDAGPPLVAPARRDQWETELDIMLSVHIESQESMSAQRLVRSSQTLFLFQDILRNWTDESHAVLLQLYETERPGSSPKRRTGAVKAAYEHVQNRPAASGSLNEEEVFRLREIMRWTMASAGRPTPAVVGAAHRAFDLFRSYGEPESSLAYIVSLFERGPADTTDWSASEVERYIERAIELTLGANDEIRNRGVYALAWIFEPKYRFAAPLYLSWVEASLGVGTNEVLTESEAAAAATRSELRGLVSLDIELFSWNLSALTYLCFKTSDPTDMYALTLCRDMTPPTAHPLLSDHARRVVTLFMPHSPQHDLNATRMGLPAWLKEAQRFYEKDVMTVYIVNRLTDLYNTAKIDLVKGESMLTIFERTPVASEIASESIAEVTPQDALVVARLSAKRNPKEDPSLTRFKSWLLGSDSYEESWKRLPRTNLDAISDTRDVARVSKTRIGIIVEILITEVFATWTEIATRIKQISEEPNLSAEMIEQLRVWKQETNLARRGLREFIVWFLTKSESRLRTIGRSERPPSRVDGARNVTSLALDDAMSAEDDAFFTFADRLGAALGTGPRELAPRKGLEPKRAAANAIITAFDNEFGTRTNRTCEASSEASVGCVRAHFAYYLEQIEAVPLLRRLVAGIKDVGEIERGAKCMPLLLRKNQSSDAMKDLRDWLFEHRSFLETRDKKPTSESIATMQAWIEEINPKSLAANVATMTTAYSGGHYVGSEPDVDLSWLEDQVQVEKRVQAVWDRIVEQKRYADLAALKAALQWIPARGGGIAVYWLEQWANRADPATALPVVAPPVDEGQPPQANPAPAASGRRTNTVPARRSVRHSPLGPKRPSARSVSASPTPDETEAVFATLTATLEVQATEPQPAAAAASTVEPALSSRDRELADLAVAGVVKKNGGRTRPGQGKPKPKSSKPRAPAVTVEAPLVPTPAAAPQPSTTYVVDPVFIAAPVEFVQQVAPPVSLPAPPTIKLEPGVDTRQQTVNGLLVELRAHVAECDEALRELDALLVKVKMAA